MAQRIMTITALVGPSSALADNTNVQIAPAAEYVDAAGKLHIPVPTTYTFHGGTLTVTAMDDTDANGNTVQWVTTMNVTDSFGQFAGTQSTVKIFPAGAPATPVPYFGDGGMIPVTVLTTAGTAVTTLAQAQIAAQAADASAKAAQAAADAAAGSSGSTVSLVQAAKNPDLLITGAVTRNGDGVVTSAVVVWPDGKPGTYTTDTINSSTVAKNAIDGYHITYGFPVTATYTQPTITRDGNGYPTTIPAIVVT